uniref:Uncharacterized protein n=1 Tax=Parascaris equorum TaxID=6256 RepID=A0A914RW61_PAREQ
SDSASIDSITGLSEPLINIHWNAYIEHQHFAKSLEVCLDSLLGGLVGDAEHDEVNARLLHRLFDALLFSSELSTPGSMISPLRVLRSALLFTLIHHLLAFRILITCTHNYTTPHTHYNTWAFATNIRHTQQANINKSALLEAG